MTNQGPNDNSQFVVSFELTQLFKWLFEHEQETIKKLIARALRNGLQDKLFVQTATETDTQDELQQNIIDFFALLENTLYELVNENEIKKVVQRNLIPALDHIDTTACDNTTVILSAAKATSTLSDHPEKNPKDILCKELLRRWKPSKKLSLN